MQVIHESIYVYGYEEEEEEGALQARIYGAHGHHYRRSSSAFTRSLSASSLSSYGTELASKEALPLRELLLPSELAQQRRHRSSNGGGEVFEDHEQDLSREHPRISSTTYYSPTIV